MTTWSAPACRRLGAWSPSHWEMGQGDFLKPELLDVTTVDEDLLREVAAACPTQAIVLEAVVDSVEGADLGM